MLRKNVACYRAYAIENINIIHSLAYIHVSTLGIAVENSMSN